MTRVSKLAVQKWDQELRSMIQADKLSPLEQGSMRIMAHAPSLAKAVATFGGAIHGNRSLPARLIELVRLRVAFHNQCRSCMAVRYQSAVEDGVTEGLVCSLERPNEAPDLSEPEKAALRYADKSATDHLSIDDAVFDDLRCHFNEAEIVELGIFIAFYLGFGRLTAAWNMIEELPEGFQGKSGSAAPWNQESVLLRR